MPHTPIDKISFSHGQIYKTHGLNWLQYIPLGHQTLPVKISLTDVIEGTRFGAKYWMALIFVGCIDNIITKAAVKIPSDWTTINPYLATLRLHDILYQYVKISDRLVTSA